MPRNSGEVMAFNCSNAGMTRGSDGDSRRRLVTDALSGMGPTFGKPKGAFYVWANISSTGIDATTLSYLLLRDAGVLVFPGTGFGENWGNYMRFTLLQPEPVLQEAMDRIRRVLAG